MRASARPQRLRLSDRRPGLCRARRPAHPRRPRPALPAAWRALRGRRRPSRRRWPRPRPAGSPRAPRRRSPGRTAGCGRGARSADPARAQLGDQLAGQPRLADPRLAGDRDQLRHPLASRSAVDQAQQVEVVLPAHEARRLLRPLGAAGHGAPHEEGCRKALRVDRGSLLELGCAAGARRPLPDEDLAGSGRLLQASRCVDCFAGHREVAGALEASTSPVSTPTRRASPSPSAPTRSVRARAAATARSGSSPYERGLRTPP